MLSAKSIAFICIVFILHTATNNQSLTQLNKAILNIGSVQTLGYATMSGTVDLTDDIDNYREIYIAAYVGAENNFVDFKKIPVNVFKLGYGFYVNYNADTGVIYSANVKYMSNKKVSVSYYSGSANFSFYIYGSK